jgi:hypothetical protein
MKRIILSTIALLALLATPPARAWTYNNGDLLLVFRNSGQPDIEFDLGSVSNLLGQANGWTTTITGWDSNLVTSTFGTDLTGVQVALLAVTSPSGSTSTAWLSGAEPNTKAYNDSQADWTSSLYGIISAVGYKPLYPINIPLASTNAADANAYSINPYGQYKTSSYDYIVSGGNYIGIAQLGGHAPFTVQQTIPGFLDFWQIQPTSIYPNPPPDHLVGTFTITANGVMTFVAGPRPSNISAVSNSSNVSSVQFTTTVGTLYSLAYTNTLGGPVSTWPVDGTTNLVGNGKINTINHNSTGNAEFYNIRAQ